MLKNNKNKRRIKMLLLIVILLLLTIIIFFKLTDKEIYIIDSRLNNIKNEKKKDNTDNYSTIGWLKVQGTNIDTPIITYYGDTYEDSEENITDDEVIDKENYLWNINGEEKLYNKVNIMGHNILNLSSQPDIGLSYFQRFDDLMAFVYYDFVKENKYIQYTIDGNDYIYKIYAVGFIKHNKLDLYHSGNYTKKELKKYIDDSLNESLFKFNVDVSDEDKILSLITCTRFFGDNNQTDFKVDARLVRKNEKLVNYKVSETKNYKEIKKVLKGDAEDEEV